MGGFINKAVEFSSLGLIEDITGTEAAAKAARGAASAQERANLQAIQAQQEAAARGQEFLQPFGGVGQQGLSQLGILTDPQQQFSFLQSNPLFQLALQNANQQTMQQAAARGRLSAGDTLQQLSNNVLLSAQPLLQNQQRNVAGLLDFGRGLATTQAGVETGTAQNVAPLLSEIGNAQAAGLVGAANANTQFNQGLLNTIGSAAGRFLPIPSDIRLKTKVKKTGEKNGHEMFEWEWNEKAKEVFGLEGKSHGVIAQNIEKYMPEAVKEYQGYKTVDYGLLGVM